MIQESKGQGLIINNDELSEDVINKYILGNLDLLYM